MERKIHYDMVGWLDTRDSKVLIKAHAKRVKISDMAKLG